MGRCRPAGLCGKQIGVGRVDDLPPLRPWITAITLGVYGHLFKTDDRAAGAMEKILTE